jgi:hypothetical protein
VAIVPTAVVDEDHFGASGEALGSRLSRSKGAGNASCSS